MISYVIFFFLKKLKPKCVFCILEIIIVKRVIPTILLHERLCQNGVISTSYIMFVFAWEKGAIQMLECGNGSFISSKYTRNKRPGGVRNCSRRADGVRRKRVLSRYALPRKHTRNQ